MTATSDHTTGTRPRCSIAVVILTWNGRDDTLECLQTLCPQVSDQDHVIVVDNGSEDGTEARVRADYPSTTFIQNGTNLGFAGGNNTGLEAALATSAEWIFVLNNDTLLDPGALDALLTHAEAAVQKDSEVGVIQPVLVRADAPDVVDSCGIALSRLPGAADLAAGTAVAELTDKPVAIFGACGAATLIHRDALTASGCFDSRLFVLFEDTDLAFRVRVAGYSAQLATSIRIRHKRGVSGKRQDDVAARKRTFWIQRNIVTLAIRWWPMRWLALASPVLLWRMLHALRLTHRHGLGPCCSLWGEALTERAQCRFDLRQQGEDRWFGHRAEID